MRLSPQDLDLSKIILARRLDFPNALPVLLFKQTSLFLSKHPPFEMDISTLLFSYVCVCMLSYCSFSSLFCESFTFRTLCFSCIVLVSLPLLWKWVACYHWHFRKNKCPSTSGTWSCRISSGCLLLSLRMQPKESVRVYYYLAGWILILYTMTSCQCRYLPW